MSGSDKDTAAQALQQRPDLELRRWQSQALLDLLRIRHASERRVEELLAHERLDVTPAQANVLMILIALRQPMTARQLASDMEVSEVTVGRFLKALEGRGWVSRERNPEDARAILVSPTTKARRALPRFLRVSNAMLDVAFSGFDKTAMRDVARAIGQVRDNIRDPQPR